MRQSLSAGLKESKEEDMEVKEKKRKRTIKFSYVLPRVILFSGDIKWNGEVKKK